MLEIEIKVKTPAISLIREQLHAKGAKLSETLKEHDIYYNAPDRDFGVTDEALRMRDTGNRLTVTYKGPKDTILGSKIREEINLDIVSAGPFDEIIKKLGFRQVAEVTKLREYYQYNEFTVSLDHVESLGDFVEIELITDEDMKKGAERVDRAALELGVTGERTTRSYLELLLSKQSGV